MGFGWTNKHKVSLLLGEIKRIFVLILNMLVRPYWRCYYSNTDAIIYVVDSADRDRIGISKDELLYMLRVSNFHK